MQASVLVVEDDAALAELLQWHLTSEGHRVRVTADGEEALLLAREDLPDLILLDWMIENLPGIEVCRQLRKDKDTARVPILMLTARGEEEDRIRGLKTGADDYVTKPFSPRELLARVEALLRRSRPALRRPGFKPLGTLVPPRRHRDQARADRIPAAAPFYGKAPPGPFARPAARRGLGS
jgi:two-component system, OmpR family, phosphate regulon response regulator PhoB